MNGALLSVKELDSASQARMTRFEAFKPDTPANALLKGMMGNQAERLMRDAWFSEAQQALRLRWCPE